MQQYCRTLGISASNKDIATLGKALKTLPPDHPLQAVLQNAPDFSNSGAMADALLNPRDRPYSVPQVFEFLAGAGLQFGRWLRQAPYIPQCGIVAKRQVAIPPRWQSCFQNPENCSTLFL